VRMNCWVNTMELTPEQRMNMNRGTFGKYGHKSQLYDAYCNADVSFNGTRWYMLDFDSMKPINLRPVLLSVAVANIVGWSKVPHLTQPPLTWD